MEDTRRLAPPSFVDCSQSMRLPARLARSSARRSDGKINAQLLTAAGFHRPFAGPVADDNVERLRSCRTSTSVPAARFKPQVVQSTGHLAENIVRNSSSSGAATSQ